MFLIVTYASEFEKVHYPLLLAPADEEDEDNLDDGDDHEDDHDGRSEGSQARWNRAHGGGAEGERGALIAQAVAEAERLSRDVESVKMSTQSLRAQLRESRDNEARLRAMVAALSARQHTEDDAIKELRIVRRDLVNLQGQLDTERVRERKKNISEIPFLCSYL
jgi:hypothetical protein